MYLLYESLLVGAYCSILYMIIHGVFRKLSYTSFFVFGFMKHFLAGIFPIQTLYCKHGHACTIKSNGVINEYLLPIESVLEGMYFMIMGSLIMKWFPRGSFGQYISIMFCLGCMTHLLAEVVGIHRIFCTYRCGN
jgi:hypothetical protein